MFMREMLMEKCAYAFFLNGNDARESVLLNGNVNAIITSLERAQKSFRIHKKLFQNAFSILRHMSF
jgi:hypothetical protein